MVSYTLNHSNVMGAKSENTPGSHTYYIQTFGCQMNVADSLTYATILEELGLVPSDSPVDCDVLVINTCSVREKAEEKAISYIGQITAERINNSPGKTHPGPDLIAFVGCMATVRGEEIKKRFPQVQVIVPATEFGSFRERLLSHLGMIRGPETGRHPSPTLAPSEKYERFVPIIRGCINRCTYCIVPAARGNFLISRPPAGIFADLERLVDEGVLSITFLGQNVCAYGTEVWADTDNVTEGWKGFRPGYGFADLLEDIRDRFSSKDIWIKFLTSHPRDVDYRLVKVIAGDPCFSRHFHLPVQAGDDKVLKRMGRGYTSRYYLDLIKKIRDIIPDMRLTTDLIVGFPGEDEEAFGNTLKLVKKVGFDSAFTFMYSVRKGTPAEKWEDPVPVVEKKNRLQELIKLQNEITLKRAESHLGEFRQVLVTGHAFHGRKRAEGLVAGRTREEEVVLLPGSEKDFGEKLPVKLTAARLRSFRGERVS